MQNSQKIDLLWSLLLIASMIAFQRLGNLHDLVAYGSLILILLTCNSLDRIKDYLLRGFALLAGATVIKLQPMLMPFFLFFTLIVLNYKKIQNKPSLAITSSLIGILYFLSINADFFNTNLLLIKPDKIILALSLLSLFYSRSINIMPVSVMMYGQITPDAIPLFWQVSVIAIAIVLHFARRDYFNAILLSALLTLWLETLSTWLLLSFIALSVLNFVDKKSKQEIILGIGLLTMFPLLWADMIHYITVYATILVTFILWRLYEEKMRVTQ